MQVQKSFDRQDQGCLYLVPTPIGNLQDMPPRAVQALAQADLIAAEDTRHTQRLLNYFEIETKQTSLHEHNWVSKVPDLVAQLQAGVTVAQVSDAGMPSISDPGRELVAAATQAGITVVPLPGPSAGITALIASGLVPQPFYFHGFLPRKGSDQQDVLTVLNQRPETVIFYEAPHRLKYTLTNLVKVMGSQRPAVLARELTKRYEEFVRGTAGELLDWAKNNEIRGEFVIMVAGNDQPKKAEEVRDELPLLDAIDQLIEQGLKPNAAIKQVAKDRQLDRQLVYRQYHQLEE